MSSSTAGSAFNRSWATLKMYCALLSAVPLIEVDSTAYDGADEHTKVRRSHICTGTRPTTALPHPHLDWARPQPHLHRDFRHAWR